MMSSNGTEFRLSSSSRSCCTLPLVPVQRWRADGSGPRYVRAGLVRVLYARHDIDEWIVARTFAHHAAEVVGV